MSGAVGVGSPRRSLRRDGGADALPVDIYLGLRLSVAGFSAMLPILGAVSAGASPPPGVLVGLVAVAMLFHVYAYLLNDVVDLDVDRREPQRAAFPLVRGAWTPAAALAIAAVQPPVAFLVTVLLGGDAAAFAMLAIAFAAMTAYNLWGKRCAFPPLMDLVQAVGWASLLLFGAALAGTVGAPMARAAPVWAASVWGATAVTAYVLLVNGVHGGLRDLANDAACGARTTAMLLGARISAGVLRIPRALIVYALGLHGVLFAAALVSWRTAAPVRDSMAAASLGLLVAVMASTLALLARAGRIRGDAAGAHSAATWHLFACMALLALPWLPRLDGATALSLAAAYSLPVLAMAGYRRRARR